MKVSYVIVTRNRRETLLRTIARLEKNPDLPRHTWELIVVDNASEDDSAGAVASHHHGVRVIRRPENEGVPARNHALPVAAGRYVVFLDDDSYPMPGAMAKALPYLAHHPKTAAIVARVILPSGAFEAPAMPSITLGGASIIRKSVLDEVGGFATEFFRQAEEYDMSCRIWKAGFKIERFEDVLFGHDKVGEGRCSALTRRMDLRNNLILVERYLPREMRTAYRHDWIRRYAALGFHEGHDTAINAALKEARVWARRESTVGRRTLDPVTLESVFGLDTQASAVAQWSKAHTARRVVIADLSKNIYATFRACRRAGLDVRAVIDNSPAYVGMRYRGVPVLTDKRAPKDIDGIILSNTNAAQIDARHEELKIRFAVPVMRLWYPKTLEALKRKTRPAQPPALPARKRKRPGDQAA